MRTLVTVFAVAGLLALLAGCAPTKPTTTSPEPAKAPEAPVKQIQVKGSDTMVNLAQAWAEEFSKKPGAAQISVTGGGSGNGIKALIEGQTDIADSSRALKAEEEEAAKAKGITPVGKVVAWDGISVITNPKNPVKKLTTAQLADIYIGKITNWKEVGGKDDEIVVLGRENTSGTFMFFKEHIIQAADKKADYLKGLIATPSNEAIVTEVASNTKAIGYVGLGYVKETVSALQISKDGKNFVSPSVATVLDKSYPVSRPLYVYTNGEPKDEIKSYIDFILSAEGQAIVKGLDFVPVSADTSAAPKADAAKSTK